MTSHSNVQEPRVACANQQGIRQLFGRARSRKSKEANKYEENSPERYTSEGEKNVEVNEKPKEKKKRKKGRERKAGKHSKEDEKEDKVEETDEEDHIYRLFDRMCVSFGVAII